MRAKQIEKSSLSRTYNNGFNAFIEEIKNGNVLLMVGRAFEANKNTFDGDFYDYVLRRLNSIAETTSLDFSDLSCHNGFLMDKENPHHIRNIHEEIVNIIEENEYSPEEDVSTGLLQLIKTGFFRFVFTTSFDPLVELAMREQFGEVRVMNIYDKSCRDISSKEDFEIPTIYYLFGKAMYPKENEIAKKFVTTDNDALEVLRKWQIDMCNSTLLRYTSEKFLLTLGCNQSDWLFRFIWYIMKGDSSKLSRGIIAGHNDCESLLHYLKINHILIDNDADELVNKIISATQQNEQTKWENPRMNQDVFISYSRADSEIAERLYNTLTAKGLTVWYDKLNLGGRHGGRFMPIIKEAIDTSCLFIAILSNSISEQSRDIHVYRREWEWAKEFKLGLTADCRCFVTFADDYDIYEKKYVDALGWLAETDNFQYTASSPDFEEWGQILQQKITDIKKHGTKSK